MVIAEQFYTLSEAASKLNVERHTVWRWVKSGKLPAQKAGGVVFIEKRIVQDMQDSRDSKTK